MGVPRKLLPTINANSHELLFPIRRYAMAEMNTDAGKSAESAMAI
jgi:hypothetical protein